MSENTSPKPIEQSTDGDNILNTDKLKILVDTNVLVAYLDKSHKFNYEAQVIIDPLKNKKCWFFIPHIVVGEFISIWSDLHRKSIKSTIDIFNKFLKNLTNYRYGGPPLGLDDIYNAYLRHAKHKSFVRAHFNDFIILTMAEEIKNIKIITCDKNMYRAGKAIFKKDIYFLPFKNKKSKSDLDRFIKDIGNRNDL